MFGDPDNNPNGYPMRRLGDVVSIERGGSPRPISQYVTSAEDGVNWIKIGDTSEDSIYISKTEEKIIRSGMKKSRYVQPGDFLLSNSMSFGRPYILKTDGCIHDGWLVLRDSSSAFDKLYLYALLDSEYAKRFFTKKAVGTTVRNLNKEIVGSMPVLLPPSEKQNEYTDLFTEVDKLRFDSLAAHMIMGQICAAANDATFACAPGSCCMCTKMRLHSAKPHFGAQRSCARCTDNAGRWGTD